MPFFSSRSVVVVLGTSLGCAHARSTPEPPRVPLPAVWRDAAGVRLSSSSGGLLREGAETLLQRRLVDLHLLAGEEVSGRLDDRTMAALRAFQARAGLAETGLPSYETVQRLELPIERVFRAGR